MRAPDRMHWSAITAAIARDGKRFWGRFRSDVLEDNTNAWSGDHCMDFTKVPGVLLSNRKIDARTPALTDIAPTISVGIRNRENHGYDGAVGVSVPVGVAFASFLGLPS